MSAFTPHCSRQEQIDVLRTAMNVREGREWDKFEGLSIPASRLQSFLSAVPFNAQGRRRWQAPAIPVPDTLAVPSGQLMSTQHGFGLLMNDIGKADTEFARRIVTTSPDVTVSTNLGGWVNRRGLFAREEMVDLFRKERIPSTFHWAFSPTGQHLELGIAGMNLFTMRSALGLSHSLLGERLLPVGTLYDPFIERGLDALNYACYQDARFILAATPPGITLAAEGGAHQSIITPLIGMGQPGLACFEPAYVDELAVCLRWAFDYIQRSGQDSLDPDDKGGSVYLRLTTRPIAQPRRQLAPAEISDVIEGGYWMRRPGPNAEVVIVYTAPSHRKPSRPSG
jgi:pyruvate dehydrogenase E1 component